MPYLACNPLSALCEYNAFKAHPKLAIIYPIVHLLGMAGYALALVCRICCLALSILAFVIVAPIVAIKERSPHAFVVFGQFVLAYLAMTASAIVGVICPILGYRMDEALANTSEFVDQGVTLGMRWKENKLVPEGAAKWQEHFSPIQLKNKWGPWKSDPWKYDL